VILAVLLLGEQRELGLSFYCGVAIIIGAVFVQPLLNRRTEAPAEALAEAETKAISG